MNLTADSFLEHQTFYLIGIKGVAMAALAQCLRDAGKTILGCDVAESFVTEKLLHDFKIEVGFEHELPATVECVVYTAAHQGQFNPMVQKAHQLGLPTYSHAQALASLFNQKAGIAVSGVGGKSTTSAMIAWILDKVTRSAGGVSFAVGVGDIVGLGKTGQWSPDSRWFVAEADEYVTDASAPSRGETITPRFSFLEPQVTVCTNLQFDHPDVYRDFDHTLAVFETFFRQIKTGGLLVANIKDRSLIEQMQQTQPFSVPVCYVGSGDAAEWQLTDFSATAGVSYTQVKHQGQTYQLELQLPGRFNAMNAVAALAVTTHLGVDVSDALAALARFRSTKRRAELIAKQDDITYYDDYAHHPQEITQLIQAFKEWYPERRLVVAFQSHTFSRTKALFNDFVTALSGADKVVMIDIFPSAREAWDDSVSSDTLCQALQAAYPEVQAENVWNIPNLAAWCKTNLVAGDVFVTVGAGDVYQVYEQLGL